MTSPTSYFICLLDQNSWHFYDPVPPSSFCPPSWRAQPARGFPLPPCHGRTECLIGFRHYVFCWKPAQSWCDKWILPAGREWRFIPPACSQKPYPPILQSTTLRTRNRDLPLGTICFCRHICWAPPVASVEEHCELEDLLGGNVWSFFPPPTSLSVNHLWAAGPTGWICRSCLSGLICINWKSVTGNPQWSAGTPGSPSDIHFSSLLEVQETIKNLMDSGEDFK